MQEFHRRYEEIGECFDRFKKARKNIKIAKVKDTESSYQGCKETDCYGEL